MSQGGTLLDPVGIAISAAANNQTAPSVVFDGANYFVVWEDRRSFVTDVYGARVSPAGTLLDPAGIPISTGSNRVVPERRIRRHGVLRCLAGRPLRLGAGRSTARE